MRAAYCKKIVIKFLRNEDGGQVDAPDPYTYEFERYMNAMLLGDSTEIDNAEEDLQAQRREMSGKLAGKGVSLDVYIEDKDVMKVYYIPVFKRREEVKASTPDKLAKGDTDFMQIASLSSGEVLQNYNDSLGFLPHVGADIRAFNMSDPSIFDVDKDEPKLEFSKGNRTAPGYEGPKGAGFGSAKVIGWRKMYMPINSDKEPDVKDFVYITTDKVAGIMTYATQLLTDAKAMGVITPLSNRTWHRTAKDVNAVNNALNLHAGGGGAAGGAAVANPAAAGALQETNTHYIMRIEAKKGQYDGTFDKAGFLPALSALAPLALLSLLKNGGDTTEEKNWTAKVLPIEFYVLKSDYLENSQTGYKPGAYLDFSSTYSDWVKQWGPYDSNTGGRLCFYSYSGACVVGAAPYEYKDYEGGGIRVAFDGGWSYLPALPECAGASGADSYFGKFNFAGKTFSPVAVTGDVGSGTAVASEDIGKSLTTITVPVSLSAGSKTPTIADLSINYDTDNKAKDPGAIARLYAMYKMKFFIGYYVYDYVAKKWLQVGEGFWKAYGDSFPAISGYTLPSAGDAAIGTSLYTYGGTWTEPSETSPASFSISNAKILDKKSSDDSGSKNDSGLTEVAPTSLTSADWQNSHRVLGPRYVYATYKTKKITFEWYVYKFDDAEGKTGKWELFHSSESYDMSDSAIEADPKFVNTHKDKLKDDSNALNLLNGKYAYVSEWILVNDNSNVPTGILTKNDGFVQNCGTVFTYKQFEEKKVKTVAGSSRATYVFYAIYDERRTFNVEFYTLEGGEKAEWKKLEAPTSGGYVWSGMVTDDNADSVDIKLPDLGDKRKIEFTGGSSKGVYEFADCWMLGVQAGAPGEIVVLENGSATVNMDLSSLGYEISASVVEGAGAVSGKIDTTDANNKKDKLVLKLLDKAKSSSTVCKLYAIYDKIYTVRFNLIGVKKAPEKEDEQVSWKNIFTTNVKVGDKISVDNLKNSEGKTVQNILDNLSDAEKFMLKPQWDLQSETSTYGYSKLWLNPGKDVAMKIKDKGGIPFCFFSASRSDAADAYTMLWHLTDDDDSRNSKKATAFSTDVFKLSEDGAVDFYAVYTLNSKLYEIRFFVPDVSKSDKEKIEWKDITPPEGEGDCIKRVEFGTQEVSVTIPDMKEYARLVFDEKIEDKESGAKVIGKYDFAYCWMKDTKVGWNDFVYLKEQMDDAGTTLGTVLDDKVGSVSGVLNGTNPAKLTVKLNKDDADTIYYLYATYDKIYTVKFHLIGSKDYPAEGSDASWGSPIFEKEIKIKDVISADALKNDGGKSVKSIISDMDASDYRLVPAWDLSLETVLAKNGKYSFQNLWFNPEKDTAMSALTNAAKCFISLIDPKLSETYSNLWHLTSADDARNTRKSDVFKLDGLFNCSGKYDDEVVFYGVYALNAKPYAVEFYVPDEESSGSELKWKRVARVSDWVEFGKGDVNVDLPDYKPFEKVKLDTDEFKGTYEYDKLWLVEQTEDWYSGETVRKSVGSNSIGTTVSTTVGLVAGGPNKAINVILADEDAETIYKLYAVYNKVFEVEFYFVREKYETAPKGDAAVNWGDPVFVSTIKEGELMCIDNLISNSKKITDVVSERLGAAGEDPTVKPTWGLIGGKTYLHTNLWFNPPEGDEDKNVLKADPADKYCFADDEKDSILELAWDLLNPDSEAAKNKTYKSKSAETFLPYDKNGCVYSVTKDGKVKFYSVYIPAKGVPYVFYVVSDFNREEFTWAPLKFKTPTENEEMEYHIAEFNTTIPDPDAKEYKKVEDKSNNKYGTETLRIGAKNTLVFKGWRRIDPKTEFDPNAANETDLITFVKKCYDVEKDENKKDLLYKCACQRVKEKDIVEKGRDSDEKFYWDKGAFVEPTVTEADIRNPYIFVAVYEYRQCVNSIFTKDPKYKGYEFSANCDCVEGITDPQSRLRQVELNLSAGAQWEMSVERKRYAFKGGVLVDKGSIGPTILTVGSDSDPENECSDYSLNVGEKKGSGYDSIFSYIAIFECVVWWIVNPSGYRFAFGFYVQPAKDSEFKMPTTDGGAPTYIENGSGDSNDEGDGGSNGGSTKKRMKK